MPISLPVLKLFGEGPTASTFLAGWTQCPHSLSPLSHVPCCLAPPNQVLCFLQISSLGRRSEHRWCPGWALLWGCRKDMTIKGVKSHSPGNWDFPWDQCGWNRGEGRRIPRRQGLGSQSPSHTPRGEKSIGWNRDGAGAESWSARLQARSEDATDIDPMSS